MNLFSSLFKSQSSKRNSYDQNTLTVYLEYSLTSSYRASLTEQLTIEELIPQLNKISQNYYKDQIQSIVVLITYDPITKSIFMKRRLSEMDQPYKMIFHHKATNLKYALVLDKLYTQPKQTIHKPAMSIRTIDNSCIKQSLLKRIKKKKEEYYEFKLTANTVMFYKPDKPIAQKSTLSKSALKTLQ